MRHRLLAALPVAAMMLCGCPGKANVIQAIELAPGQTPALDQPVNFVISGLGACYLDIDWGDGSRWADSWVDLAARTTVDHTYTGWPGGKTVTIKPSRSGCLGEARTRFTIQPATVSIAWARDPNRNTARCNAVPGRPPLAPMSLVKISSPPSPRVNFGCPVSGCVYGVDGKPGSSATAPFPFPGFREFSLVLRVGQEHFQGGSNVQFTASRGGSLELCQNDSITADNTGGWQIDIVVNQLGR